MIKYSLIAVILLISSNTLFSQERKYSKLILGTWQVDSIMLDLKKGTMNYPADSLTREERTSNVYLEDNVLLQKRTGHSYIGEYELDGHYLIEAKRYCYKIVELNETSLVTLSLDGTGYLVYSSRLSD